MATIIFWLGIGAGCLVLLTCCLVLIGYAIEGSMEAVARAREAKTRNKGAEDFAYLCRWCGGEYPVLDDVRIWLYPMPGEGREDISSFRETLRRRYPTMPAPAEEGP